MNEYLLCLSRFADGSARRDPLWELMSAPRLVSRCPELLSARVWLLPAALTLGSPEPLTVVRTEDVLARRPSSSSQVAVRWMLSLQLLRPGTSEVVETVYWIDPDRRPFLCSEQVWRAAVRPQDLRA